MKKIVHVSMVLLSVMTLSACSSNSSSSSVNSKSISSKESSTSSSSETVYTAIDVDSLITKLDNRTAKNGELYEFSGVLESMNLQQNDSSSPYPYTVYIQNKDTSNDIAVDLDMEHHNYYPGFNYKIIGEKTFKVKVAYNQKPDTAQIVAISVTDN